MKNQKIVPTQDKIIVKRTAPPETTKGGIIIPEVAMEQTDHGKVIAVGPGKIGPNGRRAEMSVKVGDTVYFTKNAVIEIEHDGSEHVMMKEERVLLVENKLRSCR